ncbi:MAG TPA: hypothetical protein PLP33_27500 [Leptospiraceae bacterium]|nr:hypothetical protein [Leptospiraceae bacterium]
MAAPAAGGGAAQIINQVLPDAIGQVINNEEFRRIEGENRRG